MNNNEQLIQYVRTLLAIDPMYNVVLIKEMISHNELPATLIRFETGSSINLFGEHISVVINPNNKYLFGFTNMIKSYSLTNNMHPNNAMTKQVAKTLVDSIDHSYFEQMDNLWIDTHDETIIKKDETFVITGMKYKCYLKDRDKYAWVIVGANNTVITFERDIIWNDNMSFRVTNKWLHDSFLEEHL